MNIPVHLDLSLLSCAELSALIAEARAEISRRMLPSLDDVEAKIVDTNPIEAIRRYHGRVGCTLRDAKDAIDRHRASKATP